MKVSGNCPQEWGLVRFKNKEGKEIERDFGM
jgi:hypothetical protein